MTSVVSAVKNSLATTGGVTTSTHKFVGAESSFGPHRRATQKDASSQLASPKSSPPPPTDTETSRDPIYLWSSIIAGVGSGALSSVVCAPLDLVRTRMQVWGDLQKNSMSFVQTFRQIIRQEGYPGCFRGLGASLATVPAFWGVYFPLYDEIKRYWHIHYPKANPSWIHCGSAVMAGAVSDIICNPMFVVRTRLQTEALHHMVEATSARPQRASLGMIRTMQVLYQEGGMPIFWRGMTANLIGLSHVAVQFPVYEHLKTRLVQQKQQQYEKHHHQKSPPLEPTPLDLFIASGLSKMTASLLTYPHEVLRSRMMDARGATGQTLLQTARRVHAREGILGFYSGLPITLLRVIPNCCITFMSYELLLRWSKQYIQERKELHRQQSHLQGQLLKGSPPPLPARHTQQQ